MSKEMLKILKITIAFFLMIILGSPTAMSEFRPTGVKESCYMKIDAYCDYSKRFINGTNWSLKDKGADNHSIYVRHYIPHEYTPYSNLFRVLHVDRNGNIQDVVGGKWCTPGLNIPIESDKIRFNEYYSVSVRGNTLYYDQNRVERIELKVNMYVNMNTFPKKKAPSTEDDMDHAIFN